MTTTQNNLTNQQLNIVRLYHRVNISYLLYGYTNLYTK